MTFGSGQALYGPQASFVRRMALGNDWTVMNVGVRFRQRRDPSLTVPDQLTTPPVVSFGLASSGDTGPRYGVQTTEDAWVRLPGSQRWWSVSVELAEAGSFSTVMRIGESDEIAGVWYARFTLTGSGLTISAFLPQTAGCPDPAAFEEQLDQADWQTGILGHTGYVEQRVTLGGPVAIMLENVSMRSTAKNYVASGLMGIDWAEVRAVRIQ